MNIAKYDNVEGQPDPGTKPPRFRADMVYVTMPQQLPQERPVSDSFSGQSGAEWRADIDHIEEQLGQSKQRHRLLRQV